VGLSWIFLIVAVWGGLWTLVSFRPPQRPPGLMVVGFFAAWTTTELAPIHILWQGGATIAFIAFGALDAWPGWVALGITLAPGLHALGMIFAASSSNPNQAYALTNDEIGHDEQIAVQRTARIDTAQYACAV